MANPAFEKAWDSHRSQAFSFMEKVCAIGPRFMGTEGERKVRDFIRHHFQAQGLHDLKAEEMEYLGYRCDSAALSVTAPETVSIPCEGIGLSAITPEGGIEAPLVYSLVIASVGSHTALRRNPRCQIPLDGDVSRMIVSMSC